MTKSADIVALHSSDGKVFYMSIDVARQAKHLENALASSMKEGETREIKLDMPERTLETVVKYLHYRMVNKELVKDQRPKFELKPEDALVVLNASRYLQC